MNQILVLNAKTNFIIGMNLGYLYKLKLKPNLYWENYVKMGISALTTNQKNEDKENKPYYEVAVFNANLGTNIRYKRVGLFFDYRFSPYNK